MTKAKRVSSVNPFTHEHVDPHCLPNLKNYKYSGSDLSIIGNNIMQPYWNAVVKLVPMTVAPNVITMTGFIISVSSTLLILWYYFRCALVLEEWSAATIPGDMYGADSTFWLGRQWYNVLQATQPVAGADPIPHWAWYYCAFALFAYQTLDAIDGKQARRTQSGSPMGELFDHGCDAFFTPLLQVNICLATGMTIFSRFHFFLLITSGLLLSIWEQFSTGTLDLGYINGPTDGILIVVGVFLATGTYGAAFWHTKLAPLAPSVFSTVGTLLSDHVDPQLGSAVTSMTAGEGLVSFVIATSVFTFIGNVLHVLIRKRVRRDAFFVLTPNIAVFALFLAVFHTRPGIITAFPFAVELCYGFLASYTATRLTVARLCEMPYRPISWFFLLSFIVSFLSIGSTLLLDQKSVLHTAAAPYEAVAALLQTPQLLRAAEFFADDVVCGRAIVAVILVGVIQYLHLIVSVFRQLAHFLDIKVFSIKKKKTH